MSKIVVADSTCLIGLSKIGLLELLRELFERIVIPVAVYDEVVTSGVIGTVAVLAKSHEKGLIGDLPSALEQLRQVGFHFPVN